MTSHSQRTQHGPSRLSIIVGWGLVGLDIGLVSRILTRDDLDEGHMIGAMLGIVLGALLVGQTVGRVGDRMLAQDRIRRAAARQAREQERAVEEVTGETGTWRGDSVGEVLTVRHERATATYHVRGWLGDHWQIRHEMPWTHAESLAAHLSELEAGSEMRPDDDEGTRAIRARLMLPGWDTEPPRGEDGYPEGTPDFVTVEEWQDADAARQRAVGEETAVIQYTDQGLPRRPVGETLRPIDVAAFRTELDRQSWYDDSRS